MSLSIDELRIRESYFMADICKGLNPDPEDYGLSPEMGVLIKENLDDTDMKYVVALHVNGWRKRRKK